CSHACIFCFARPTHEYLGLNAGEDFERKIVVKVNAVERLRAELVPARWAGDPIAMGTNTDPYQRCEGKYRLTRGIVEVLGEAANPFSILTKSTLILRDLGVLIEAAARTDVHTSFSIGPLDEEVWRSSEPRTPHPRRRVEYRGLYPRSYAPRVVQDRVSSIVARLVAKHGGVAPTPSRERQTPRDATPKPTGSAQLSLMPPVR